MVSLIFQPLSARVYVNLPDVNVPEGSSTISIPYFPYVQDPPQESDSVLALRQQLLEAQREAELLRSVSRTQAPSDGVDGWTKRWGLGFMVSILVDLPSGYVKIANWKMAIESSWIYPLIAWWIFP